MSQPCQLITGFRTLTVQLTVRAAAQQNPTAQQACGNEKQASVEDYHIGITE